MNLPHYEPVCLSVQNCCLSAIFKMFTELEVEVEVDTTSALGLGSISPTQKSSNLPGQTEPPSPLPDTMPWKIESRPSELSDEWSHLPPPNICFYLNLSNLSKYPLQCWLSAEILSDLIWCSLLWIVLITDRERDIIDSTRDWQWVQCRAERWLPAGWLLLPK